MTIGSTTQKDKEPTWQLPSPSTLDSISSYNCSLTVQIIKIRYTLNEIKDKDKT